MNPIERLEVLAKRTEDWIGATDPEDVAIVTELRAIVAELKERDEAVRRGDAHLVEAARLIDEWRDLVARNPPGVSESPMYHERADMISRLIHEARLRAALEGKHE